MSSGAAARAVVSPADGAPFEPASRVRACPCEPQPCFNCRLLLDGGSQQTEATEMTQDTQPEEREPEPEPRPPPIVWNRVPCSHCLSPVFSWRLPGGPPATCIRTCCLAAFSGMFVAYRPEDRPRPLQPLGSGRYQCPFCPLVLVHPPYPEALVYPHPPPHDP